MSFVDGFIEDLLEPFSIDNQSGSAYCEHHFIGDDYLVVEGDGESGKRKRKSNEFGYKIGDIYKSNWYRRFLHPDVCDLPVEEHLLLNPPIISTMLVAYLL